jgi:type I restriction enzyme, S subunit
MSWKKVKLGDICTIEKGATGIQKAIEGDYPLVVTGEERKSHNEFQFDDEAVLIPLVSGTGHGHASLKRIHFQSGKFALGTILCAVIPKNKEQLSAEYLFRFLDLNKENELVARMKGMANVTLPMKEIAQIEIPLPQLKEQIDFVEKYKTLEVYNKTLDSEITYQLNILKQLRQQFLQEAVQGILIKNEKLKDKNTETGAALLKRIKAEKAKAGKKEKPLAPIKKEEIPFEIPDDWVWCRLGEIIEFTQNLNIETQLSPDTMINYVDIDAIDNQKYEIRESKLKSVSELSSRARRILRKGYIVYSLVRPYLNNIAIVEDEKLNYIGSTGFAVFNGINMDNRFLKIILLSEYIRKLYLEMLTGFNSPSISQELFIMTLIPLPPLSIQAKIVEKVNSLMGLCDEIEGSIRASQKQNEGLLQEVLRAALAG